MTGFLCNELLSPAKYKYLKLKQSVSTSDLSEVLQLLFPSTMTMWTKVYIHFRHRCVLSPSVHGSLHFSVLH